MKILILEDNDKRIEQFQRHLFKHDVTVVKHAYECVRLLNTQEFDLICLDHDLNGKQMDYDKEDCGTVVAEWIASNPIKGKVLIHSFNQPAAIKMKQMIPNSEYIPGLWTETVIKRLNIC